MLFVSVHGCMSKFIHLEISSVPKFGLLRTGKGPLNVPLGPQGDLAMCLS